MANHIGITHHISNMFHAGLLVYSTHLTTTRYCTDDMCYATEEIVRNT